MKQITTRAGLCSNPRLCLLFFPSLSCSLSNPQPLVLYPRLAPAWDPSAIVNVGAEEVADSYLWYAEQIFHSSPPYVISRRETKIDFLCAIQYAIIDPREPRDSPYTLVFSRVLDIHHMGPAGVLMNV